MRILFLGPQWHGSNSTGLTRAFRRLGHIVQELDLDAAVPSSSFLFSRIARRVGGLHWYGETNRKAISLAQILRPHIVIGYKGRGLLPGTLKELKSLGAYAVLVYPDTSFVSEGAEIRECLDLYDWVFTTKSFGVKDYFSLTGKSNCELLPHGFDPEVHRPFNLSCTQELCAQVGFIGGWSKKKEKYLAAVAKSNYNMRIWGGNWYRARTKAIQKCTEGIGLFGDMYSLAIQNTTINLGLLYEGSPGAAMGDQVTSRSFHIPASGGFLLHERTSEFLEFFAENLEAACFSDPEDLVEKIGYFLNHEAERESIRIAGHLRCIKENDLILRAERIIDHYLKRKVSDRNEHE